MKLSGWDSQGQGTLAVSSFLSSSLLASWPEQEQGTSCTHTALQSQLQLQSGQQTTSQGDARALEGQDCISAIPPGWEFFQSFYS